MGARIILKVGFRESVGVKTGFKWLMTIRI
jgi:hypothetical protein